MAQMKIPTAEEKAKEVAKAQRAHDALKAKVDAARAVIAEIEPGLKTAERHLEWVKSMPTSDDPVEAEPAPEQGVDHQDVFA